MEGTIAEIRMFGGNFAPRNWAFCAGQLIAISSNSALFSVLGTTYGGDGRTTFALPDLRGRVAISPGQGPGLSNYFQGESAGIEQVALNLNQLPAHNHSAQIDNAAVPVTVRAYDGAGDEEDADGHSIASFPNLYTTNAPDADLAAGSASVNLGGVPVAIGTTGGSQPFTNVQPYLAVYYIICLQGVYPSRS